MIEMPRLETNEIAARTARARPPTSRMRLITGRRLRRPRGPSTSCATYACERGRRCDRLRWREQALSQWDARAARGHLVDPGRGPSLPPWAEWFGQDDVDPSASGRAHTDDRLGFAPGPGGQRAALRGRTAAVRHRAAKRRY